MRSFWPATPQRRSWRSYLVSFLVGAAWLSSLCFGVREWVGWGAVGWEDAVRTVICCCSWSSMFACLLGCGLGGPGCVGVGVWEAGRHGTKEEEEEEEVLEEGRGLLPQSPHPFRPPPRTRSAPLRLIKLSAFSWARWAGPPARRW